MHRLWLAIAAFLILCGTAQAQGVATPQLVIFNGAPSGSCQSYQMALDTTQTVSSNLYSCVNGGWVRVGANAGLAHQPAFYPQNGTAISGTCSVPATNGQFPMIFNVTADAAVDPTCPQSGFLNTAITGAATSYPITAANNQQGIEHDTAGSQSVNYPLPTPTTLENPNFAIPQICNYSAHIDTLTPATWTVNGAASVTIPPNTCRNVTVDPFNSNNWLSNLASLISIGTISISSATSASHSFAIAYAVAPNCQITPASDPTSVGVYWATSSTSAVTANIKSSGTITFNFMCGPGAN